MTANDIAWAIGIAVPVAIFVVLAGMAVWRYLAETAPEDDTDRRSTWVRFVEWMDRHRASRVYEYTRGVERLVLSLARQHLALERQVAELRRRLDELDPKGGAV